MDKSNILENINRIFEECEGNTILEKNAICPEVASVNMFEAPIVGFGSAKDSLFETFKEEDIIGPWYMKPSEWLSEAQTVISLFFPFTEQVKENSRNFTKGPSPAWLHGRVEGQDYINTYMEMLSDWFTQQEIGNCVPSSDSRFAKVVAGNNMREFSCVNEKTFGSNWSERHAAYVCGLGTFGLSKGIITKKGMAGRFGSIIIDLEIDADERAYSGIYDYCTKCGACIRRCPAKAITAEYGKNHNVCNEWLQEMSRIHAPRYGCGLCQTKVPCESRIPNTEFMGFRKKKQQWE